MLNPELVLSFLTVSFLLAVTPGPSNAFLMAQTFANGRTAGMQTAMGFAVAGVVHTLLMVVGLSTLLKTNATAFQVVLWLGAAYLVYLGITTIISTFTPSQVTADQKPHVSTKKKASVFQQALITELLNPKVAMFFIAFIPQFTDPTLSTSITTQLLIFGLAYPILAFPIDYAYVHFGDKIASYFRQHPTLELWIERITGLIFITLAINLVFF